MLLAAGAGRRMGRAKALVTGPDGVSFVERGIAALRHGGCHPVVVVLGAEAKRVRPLAAAADRIVEAGDWAAGQSSSVRAGLDGVADLDAYAVCLLLVDLPDVGADVVRRVREAAGDGPTVLARAAYDGVPGHPVVIGRDHVADLLETLSGDTGARGYLASHDVLLVECGDLATGRDVDRPQDL
nr:nucleotidyltransferase family protein [Knoellia sp. DB2414S]